MGFLLVSPPIASRNSMPSNRLRVVLMGAESAGKSSLLRALQSRTPEETDVLRSLLARNCVDALLALCERKRGAILEVLDSMAPPAPLSARGLGAPAANSTAAESRSNVSRTSKESKGSQGSPRALTPRAADFAHYLETLRAAELRNNGLMSPAVVRMLQSRSFSE